MKKDRLPSIDGKRKGHVKDCNCPLCHGEPLIRPKAKSHDRHQREVDFIIAKRVDLSPTQFQRIRFIKKYADKDVYEALKSKEISVWRAYKLTRAKQFNKMLEFVWKKIEEEKFK